jgi:hypothetical protein
MNMLKAQAVSRPWTREENRVVERYARAIVRGRYRNVKEALPECQRELGLVVPAGRRTDLAVAWSLLCRAYDFGLPRRKHFWTDPELRLLKRHASALVRGEYPNTGTAVRAYKSACERAGLAARHPDNVIQSRVITLARAMGGEPVTPRFGPAELRVIAGFSRALARNEYPYGMAAVADCYQALARAGLAHRRCETRLAALINAGARKAGWQGMYAEWSAPAQRVIERFAQELAAGRYPSIAAAVRACQESLKRAGEFGNRTEAGLARKLRVQAMRHGLPQSRPRWKRAELRIVDRFARACILNTYPNVTAAVAVCRRALERAGLPEHLRGEALASKLLQRVHELR